MEGLNAYGSFDLHEYVALAHSLPRPTPAQMEAFAIHVSNAHSWYKHLPLLPPGGVLQFFIDPSAGMQLGMRPDGSIGSAVRTERGFHYSWLPTVEYRSRFGHLAFSRSAGTSVQSVGHDGTRDVGSDDVAAVLDGTVGRLRALPAEVLRAGRARVSGLIHTLGPMYLGFVVGRSGKDVDWPAASGGRARYAEIVERWRAIMRDRSLMERMPIEETMKYDDPNLFQVDMPLHRLLEPERRRQRAGMVEAMQRVTQLLDRAAPH